ncbi:MAG: hypothetical protein QHH00_05245 [Methanomassiliicoccales archaeon]|jgi:predicted nuclease with TOPRIM domain|nr:hypothetical protein [Methanomassiliicoccales archaeon]
MRDEEHRIRLEKLEKELAELEANRPAHSPKLSLEMRIDELRDEIAALKKIIGRQ